MNNEIKNLVKTLLDIDNYAAQIEGRIDYIQAFNQVWGSTALGFGGWGGASMTDALTTVIKTHQKKYYVFFGGDIAYVVENPTEKFFEDLEKKRMASCEEAKKLY